MPASHNYQPRVFFFFYFYFTPFPFMLNYVFLFIVDNECVYSVMAEFLVINILIVLVLILF